MNKEQRWFLLVGLGLVLSLTACAREVTPMMEEIAPTPILPTPTSVPRTPTRVPPTATPTPKPPTPTPTPVPAAEFEVSSLQVSPAEVFVGDAAIIEVSVSNVGNARGVYSGDLRVNEEVVDTLEVTLAPGDSETISFKLQKGEPGTYTVALDAFTSELIVREPTASEVVSNMTEASLDVESYRFEMDMTAEMVGAVEGQELAMTYKTGMKYAIDSTTGNSSMDMSVSTQMPGMSVDTGMHTLTIDGDIYLKTRSAETEVGWMKLGQTSEEFDEISRSSDLSQAWLDMAGASSQAELLGRDRLDGTDCYIVGLMPDPKEFWQTFVQQAGMELAEEVEGLPIELGDMFQDISFKWWVSRDTWLPVKVQVEMTMVMSSDLLKLETVPEEEFELTMPFAAELTYHSYNEPVVIEAPLAIGPLVLCSEITEAGECTVQPGAIFGTGQEVLVYAPVTGFERKELDGTHEVWVELQHIKLNNPEGETVIDQDTDLVEVHSTAITVEDFVWFRLPLGTAGSGDPLGEYTFELAVRDRLSGETATGVVNFTLE